MSKVDPERLPRSQGTPSLRQNRSPAEAAATVVARGLAHRVPGERGRFLRELLAHTAAGLVVIEGEVEASEAVYRLADAVVARGAL